MNVIYSNLTAIGCFNNFVPALAREYVHVTSLRSIDVPLSLRKYVGLIFIFLPIFYCVSKIFNTTYDRIDNKIGTNSLLSRGIKWTLPIASIALSTVCLNYTFSLMARPFEQFFIYKLHYQCVFKASLKMGENLKLAVWPFVSGRTQTQNTNTKPLNVQDKLNPTQRRLLDHAISQLKRGEFDAKSINIQKMFFAGSFIISNLAFSRLLTNIFVAQALSIPATVLTTGLFARTFKV